MHQSRTSPVIQTLSPSPVMRIRRSPPYGYGYATHSFYVDTSAAVAGSPRVVRSRNPGRCSLNRRHGATTGIQSYRWTMGDGTVRTTVRPLPATQVPSDNDTGSLGGPCTDLAGNQMRRSFRVSIPPTPPPATGPAVVGPPSLRPLPDPPLSAPRRSRPNPPEQASCRKARAARTRSSRAMLRLRRAYRRNPTTGTKRAASRAKTKMLRAKRVARRRCNFQA